jgi:hypothetical protein
MENLRFTQRVLHYYDFLLRDYGFVYADEFDLNPSFIDGGRFEGLHVDVVLRLGRRVPGQRAEQETGRNSLALFFASRETGPEGQPARVVDFHDLVEALEVQLDPCPVTGEIRTRDMLDLALAYYAGILRSHFDMILRGEKPPVPSRQAIAQSA